MPVNSYAKCYTNCVACNKIHELDLNLFGGSISISGVQRTVISQANVPFLEKPATNAELISVIYDCPIPQNDEILKVIVDLPIDEYKNTDVQGVTVVSRTRRHHIFPTRLPVNEQRALIDFGSSLFSNSISKLNDFITFMVPLTTGLITAYIAILQFKGINSPNSSLLCPPIFMLISLGLFIIASFPIPRYFSTSIMDNISKIRTETIYWKFIWAALGGALFLVGLALMVAVIIPPLSNTSVNDEAFSLYKNLKFGYSISHPSNWEVQIANNSKEVSFRMPDESHGPIIGISALKILKPPKLQDYARERMHVIHANDSSISTLDNNPSYMLKWNNASNSGLEVVSIVNDTAFRLDYSANKLDYPIFLPTSQNVFESFKLNK